MLCRRAFGGWLPVLLVLVALGWETPLGRAQSANAEPLLNQPAPAIERADLDGRPLSLAALRGKVVLLNFWATWCAPCQIELPRFVAWKNQYGRQGLEIVGISMDDEVTPARAVAQKRRLNYPVAMGDEKLGQAYGGILGLPLSMLIDRQGNIAVIFRGESNLEEMENRIKTLLAQP